MSFMTAYFAICEPRPAVEDVITSICLGDDSTEQPGLTDELRAIRRSTSSRIRLMHFIIVTLAVTVLAIFLPAYIFKNVETGWSYIDAVYFCFISLTTIGLGDLVPSVRSWDGSIAPTVVHSIYHSSLGVTPVAPPSPVACRLYMVMNPGTGGEEKWEGRVC
ncbi:unnamed protein product [Schistocephalus solidus]|uniref:Potassium channel domain-containing protein n=1 Tax=Schistocephalus solidus TaxID=70667 RepID=A0A3P7DFU7_SCHSO|nr:unnamed protein product [Schistocephalus solidus]